MNHYKISVIIPVFNRPEYLEEFLVSLLQQEYTNWEAILVDDHSTETKTIDILENYSKKDARITWYKRPNDLKKGANSCRNFGFNKSTGTLIQWFDSDDIMLPNYLQAKINLFTEDKKVVITSGSYCNSILQEIVPIEIDEKCEDLFESYITWKNKILTPSVLFTRNFLLQNNLFVDFISRGQEAEFFSRMFFKLSNQEYVIQNFKTFLYRQHQDTASSKSLRYNKDFKFSHAYIYTQNLQFSIQKKSKIGFQYCLDRITNLFIESNKNKDFKTVNYLKDNFFKKYFTSFLDYKIFNIAFIFMSYNNWKNFVNRKIKFH